MRYAFGAVALITVLAVGLGAVAAEEETLGKLDEALKAAASFEAGGDSGPLRQIEQIVFQLAPGSELRAAVEAKLLVALESATTSDAKRFLCRQLRVIGTEKCVPHLAKLLTDPDLSHMARYALGRLETPDASAALHRALLQTSGKMQAGIINTLADRGCEEAKPDVVRLLTSSEPMVAMAAAAALGRLGGADAVQALNAARAKASEELAIEIDNALLGCAEQLAAEGKTDEAAGIYESFYKAGPSPQLRCAGLRGLVLTRGEQTVGLLRNAIQSGDADLQRTAISYVPFAEGDKAAIAFAGVLDSLPPEGQVLLLHALGRRSDASAASGVMWRATKSEEQAVRIAALEALGKVADASAVDALAQAAAEVEGVEKEVARRSLRLLEADGVDSKLMQSILQGDPKRRVEVIHALAGRGVAAAVGPLVKAAEDDDPSVRQEAIRALGMLAGDSDLGPIVALAVNPKGPDDRSALVEALGKVFLRIEDKASCARPVLAALAKAPAEAKPALVMLLGKSGSAEALRAVRDALASTDAPMRDAAVRALSEWPDASASDDLVELVATADGQEQKQIALEGYVRMAAMSDDPTAMYLQVLKRVERANDKKLVLEGLGLKSEAPEALQLALDHLDDEDLQATAGLAALRIAHRLRTRDEQLARSALHKVLETVDHEDVHQRAQEVLNDLDKYQDHILQWVAAGPFTEKGKDGAAVYATPFPPEKPGAEGVEWQPITKGIGSWDINLEATFGGLDFCAAYLKTRVWSEIEQEALLEMGSDDGVKAWVNGQVVFDGWNEGSAAPRQKRIKVRLAKGWNELMLKVVDQQGGWVAACRVRKPDGTALEGLKVEAP